MPERYLNAVWPFPPNTLLPTMPSHLARLTVLTAVLTGACFLAQAHAASFQGIGDIAGGSFQSTAQGISADGLTVVGQGQGATSANVAVIWTAATGIKALYSSSTSGVANKVSANGSVVVGRDDSAGGRAFRYSGSFGFKVDDSDDSDESRRAGTRLTSSARQAMLAMRWRPTVSATPTMPAANSNQVPGSGTAVTALANAEQPPPDCVNASPRRTLLAPQK